MMKRVLVVDDTKNIRLLLTKCLEFEGFRVSVANDGRQALDMFEKESFDLAFFDIKMPFMSGTEVLRRIRERGIKIPVVIITAYASIKNAVECTQLGAVAYLQKPFTADKVRAVLSEIWTIPSEEKLNLDSEVDIQLIEDMIAKGQTEESIKMLRKAIAIDQLNPQIYYLFGKVYQYIDDIENAKKFNSLHKVLAENLKE